MKKLLMSLALAAAVSLPAVAQSTTPTTQIVSNRAAEPQEEDFQRMMRNTYKGWGNNKTRLLIW